MPVYEIGIDCAAGDLEIVECTMRRMVDAGEISGYYVEPPNRFASLADLEAQCEGK